MLQDRHSKSFPFGPLVALLFAGFFFYCLRPVEDHDVWLHLAAGRYIVTHLQIPRYDVFSWTCAGSPWVDTYWLYQILLYGLYRLGGLSFIILYKAVLPVLIFWPVYQRMRFRGGAGVWILAGLWLAFWGSRLSSVGWGERASLVTWFGVSCLLWHLEGVHWKKWPRKSLWIWPVVLVIWANLHQGFLLGLGLIGLYALGEEITAKGKDRFLWTWAIVCAAVTLITPHGLQLYRMLLIITTNTAGIAEWQRTPWKHMIAYWCILVCFWGSLLRPGVRKHPLSKGFLLIALALSYGSFTHVLHVPFFVVFAVPWMIDAMVGSPFLKTLTAYLERSPRRTAALATLVITAFAVKAARGIQGGIDMRKFPVVACRFIEQMDLPGPFYNAYAFGGYWMWHFGERRLNFIDGRCPTVEGSAILWDAIREAQGGSPEDWQNFLSQWKVRSVLLDNPSFSEPGSVYPLYFPSTQWELVYRDPTAVIYVRRTPASAKASPSRGR